MGSTTYSKLVSIIYNDSGWVVTRVHKRTERKLEHETPINRLIGAGEICCLYYNSSDIIMESHPATLYQEYIESSELEDLVIYTNSISW